MTKEILTEKKLRLVFTKLKRDAGPDGNQPTISSIARELGVSHTLIHNKFPEIAQEIRNNNGKNPKQRLAKHKLELAVAEARSAELRKELTDIKLVNKGLASQNSTLILLVKQLESEVDALQAGAVPLRLRPKRPPK